MPIPVESCESFDPSSPPTVPQLVRELNEYDAMHKEGSKLKGKIRIEKARGHTRSVIPKFSDISCPRLTLTRVLNQ